MDLYLINSILLPFLVLMGMIVIVGMMVIILIDTVGLYKRREERKRGDVTEKRAPPESEMTESAAVVGLSEALSESLDEAGAENNPRSRDSESERLVEIGMDQTSKRSQGKYHRVLGRFRVPLASILKRKKEAPSKPLTFTSIPILKEAQDQPHENLQKSTSAANQISQVEQANAGTSKDQMLALGRDEKESSAEEKKRIEKKGEPISSRDQEGKEPEEEIKVKQLSSLADAKEIIEAKVKEADKKKSINVSPTETDDVASLLGIAQNAGEKEGPSSETTNLSPNVISQAAKFEGKKPEEASGREDAELQELLSEPSAADLLQRNEAIDEVIIISKQLAELKSSLIQLDQKLKSLKKES
ncbi:MAG: hypothetical protein H5T33_02890 [Candidatus Methanosuratus sp.]|nr:hypothetical protein [Candidatus Methanosuratincola sp.]